LGIQLEKKHKIVKKDKEVLNKAEQVVKMYRNKEYVEYEEYLYLYKKLKKLIEQVYYIFEISDTYQDRLIKIKENLKQEVTEKNEMENKLNNKIRELKKSQKELKKANEKLKNLSTRDQLTGLYNRREFERIITKEWRHAIRELEPISLIMIDIDNFKPYNDNYGHLAGDNCLQEISRCMDGSLKRPRDFIARFGGEEFVVILPDTDGKGALHTAERIRKDVFDLQIPHKYSNVEEYITISLGIASTGEADLFLFEELLDKADQALYKAKETGKNKCCVENLEF